MLAFYLKKKNFKFTWLKYKQFKIGIKKYYKTVLAYKGN